MEDDGDEDANVSDDRTDESILRIPTKLSFNINNQTMRTPK
jgi:hypothetical protein